MNKPRVGLIGWRGMVGSVLMQRMREENDFAHIEPVFFSTSAAGSSAPAWAASAEPKLLDAMRVEDLARMDIIVTAQGSEHTLAVHAPLRAYGWRGLWIDASKALRMRDDAVIVLDPINRSLIDAALRRGVLDYCGGNCTVSCMLMGLGALFAHDWVQWMQCSTYQAASGGGAQHMRELLTQFGCLERTVASDLADPSTSIIDIDAKVLAAQRALTPAQTQHFGAPLAGSLLPWIDADRGDGSSLEEWKGQAELNKILGRGDSAASLIPVDSTCVRVGAMRCHSQSLTIKLRQALPLTQIEDAIRCAHEWVQLVPNNKADTLRSLTPLAVQGTLKIAVGRLRTLAMGPQYLGAFTVGDQLLWGAAEPLRRMLRIALQR